MKLWNEPPQHAIYLCSSPAADRISSVRVSVALLFARRIQRKDRIALGTGTVYATGMLDNQPMCSARAGVNPTALDSRWDAVMRRERTADGQFFYAVVTTGVFCRPSCPSRRPLRENVRFFATTIAAERAGFRACRRCRPKTIGTSPTHDAIQRASRYLAEHADETVSLVTLARIGNVSASHLQRQFKQALGVSPREYQAACRADRFRRELRSGRDVSSAMYEAGYGSPSRVYESTPTGRGMQPATYRRGGAGAEVGYATVKCDLGWLLVAATEKGVCAVKLGDSEAMLETDLRREFPAAHVFANPVLQADWLRAVVERVNGVNQSARQFNLPLDVRGTAFQWRVWRALQAIPAGDTRSYSEVAASIGQPSAVRAVARACAANPVCVVVPCHRVVGKHGAPTGYRWGLARKERLLKLEKEAK